jgi:hypothetical protein
MINYINNFFIKTDILCDYIPVLSTLSNLTVLFQKSVVIPNLSAPTTQNNRYFTHIKDKSFTRCVILLIPLLGNILVGFHDIYRHLKPKFETYLKTKEAKKRDIFFSKCTENPQKVSVAFCFTEEYQKYADDKQIGFKLLEIVPEDLVIAMYRKLSPRLKKDIDIFLKITERSTSGHFFSDVPGEIKDNEEAMLLVSEKFPNSFRYASERLRSKKEVALKVVSRWGDCLGCLSDDLKKDPNVVEKAMNAQANGDSAFLHADKELRAQYALGLKAVRMNGKMVHFLSEELKDNKEIIEAAMKAEKNPEKAICYASLRIKKMFNYDANRP